MNREILFRGKVFLKEEWVYGDLVKTKNLAAIKKADGDYFHPTQVSPNTVGQYTGLKDKNGKEIFEGDILDYTELDVFGEDHQYRGVVKWTDDCFVCDNSDNSDSITGLAWVVKQSIELEIIGNVHDNPELLKQQRQ